jgi:signal transduction histidine kinase
MGCWRRSSSLAARAPFPVTVDGPDERFAEPVESAAYFVACEGLANIGKYARASRADISVSRLDGRLVIRVADDGVGGADVNAGSGLKGLVDRVAAIDGVLTLESQPGTGTIVTAEFRIA